MGKKQLMILIPVILALAIGIKAVTKGKNPRKQAYSFTINDFKMVRSSKKAERKNEDKYILDNLLNEPHEFSQFPLAQSKGRMFMDAAGKHISPGNRDQIVPRADIVSSKGQAKIFYKLRKSPWRTGSSRVVCIPRSWKGKLPGKKFRYKFKTKAEKTKYGTISYTCYVDAGSNKIKKLFDDLPGKTVRGVKTIGTR